MSFMESISDFSNSVFQSTLIPNTCVDPELKKLLVVHLLEDYEARLVSHGILTVEQLKKLNSHELEKLIPEKPVHARRLADSSPALSPILVEDSENREEHKPSSPRVSLKERRKTDKSPTPRGKRSGSTDAHNGVRDRDSKTPSRSSVSPPGKRTGTSMFGSSRAPTTSPVRKDTDSPHSSVGSGSPISILKNPHQKRQSEMVTNESKKTAANFRFQRTIKRVMLANKTIRVWREGLGRELMAIVREKNNLVENPEFRDASHAKKVHMKLVAVSTSIARLVQSYKQRGLRPSFPATQVALFLQHFPGDVCHGERLFAALALLDCMDSQEAGDVSDTVGCSGKTKNAEDGFGFWHALDPNKLTPHLHPLFADLMAAEGAEMDAKKSADYLQGSLHEMRVQLSYLIRVFGAKHSWRKFSNAAASAGSMVLKMDSKVDDSASPKDIESSLSPDTQPTTIAAGLAASQPPSRQRSFTQSISEGVSGAIPQFSPSFSIRKRTSTNLDAGEGDAPISLLSHASVHNGTKQDPTAISAKAAGNEEERNARALKRFATRVATSFVLSGAASAVRCVENAREAVTSAESANEGLRIRQWGKKSKLHALGTLGEVRGGNADGNFSLPRSVLSEMPTKHHMFPSLHDSHSPEVDRSRGRDLGDMIYDALRRSVLLNKNVKKSPSKTRMKSKKLSSKAAGDEEDEEEEDDPDWLEVAELVHATVLSALIKMDISLTHARRDYDRAVRLAKAHRREWSEKLPILASIPGFREDLTSAYVDPFVGNLDYSDDPDQAPGEIRTENYKDSQSLRSARAKTITQELSAKEARVKLMKASRGGFAKHQGRLNKEVEAVERRTNGWNEASRLISFLRQLESVVFVAVPPDDAQMNHNLLITKSGLSDSNEDTSVLASISANIRNSLLVSAQEKSLKPGCEAEVSIDVNTGDAIGFVKKREELENSFNEKDRELSRSTSRKTMFSFKSPKQQGMESPLKGSALTSQGTSTSPGSVSASSPPVKRKSVVENTAEIFENIKAAIGITKEELSRKLMFQIPEGVQMGDSVLVLTAPTNQEASPDSNGYYPPVQAKECSLAPQEGAPSILKAHHRNRRRTADAFFSLGVIYTGGKGVKFDQKKAVLAWEVSAALGHGQAQNNLGIMYANGDGAKRNDARAFEMYSKAAENGIASANYNLGNMLAHGRGCKKNEAAAIARWLNAARENHLGAHFNVGVMFEKGLGVDKPDAVRAIAHYTAAAERGHKDANFNLAFLYHHGAEGVDPSNALALRYYARAAALGDHEAEYMLQRLKR